MKKLTYLFFCIATLFVFSCQDGKEDIIDVEDKPIENPVEELVRNEVEKQENQQITAVFSAEKKDIQVAGTVSDQNGKVKGVNISFGGKTIQSNENGFFTFDEALPALADLQNVTFEKDGYFKGIKSFKAVGNQIFLNLTLIEKGDAQSVDFQSGGIATFNNNIQLDFPTHSFIYADGTPVTKDVQVYTHYHDPNSDDFSSQMPGMLYGINEENQTMALVSHGMLSVELEDTNGKKVEIAKDKTVKMQLPTLEDSPESIPLWHLNETYGVWVQKGFATQENGVFIAEVNDFSTWNLDLEINGIEIEVEFVDQNENPLAGASVEVSIKDGKNLGIFDLDANGKAILINPSLDEILELTIFNSCGEIEAFSFLPKIEEDAKTFSVNLNRISTINGVIRDCNIRENDTYFLEISKDKTIISFHPINIDKDSSFQLNLCIDKKEKFKILKNFNFYSDYHSFSENIQFNSCDFAIPSNLLPNVFAFTYIIDEDNKKADIPTNPDFNYSYTVDWGDGTITNENSDATHTYTKTGRYIIKITGIFPAPYFRNINILYAINQWGHQEWKSMESAFFRCHNLTFLPNDQPNFSNVNNMNNMFQGSSDFNQDISSWDVSNVNNMSNMFEGSDFNQDISNWDVSNVNNMSNMFKSSDFNQDISTWDVSNVNNMSNMFKSSDFNQDISTWDVSNVNNMSNMFSRAKFNQDISNWNVGNVSDMNKMFSYTKSFNQDISNWNVGNVSDMSNMFLNAEKFNQDLSKWNVGNVSDMSGMFQNAEKFNQDLSKWNVGNVSDMSGIFKEARSFNGNIRNWDVSNVKDMSNMFFSARNFNQNIGEWNVGQVNNMRSMFDDAIRFNQNISNWNVSKVTKMSSMFSYARSFNQNLSNWNVSKVRDYYNFSTESALTPENLPKFKN